MAMSVMFQNPTQEIPVETVEMTKLLLDMIILTLLFRARKGFGLLIVTFRKIRVEDESVMQIHSEGSVQDTGPDTITPEELLSLKK
jgi:hypothetical protein